MKKRYYSDDIKRKFHHRHKHHDIRRYRRQVRVFRPISIIISLLILYSFIKLFATGQGAYVLAFILFISLLKEIFAYLHFKRLTTHILEPIEKLKKAVDEVSVGNYGVTVKEKTPDNEIGQLIHSFNRMSIKLRESEELKKKYELNRKNLIAVISHDLKTPITSILGYVEGIKEGVAHSPEKINKYINIIHQNAEYTNNLINDLFLFSTLDIQRLDFDFINTSIKAFMDDLFTELIIEFKEQLVEVSFSDELDIDKSLMLDGKRIKQVILNIINNAIKYSDKSQVEISCTMTPVTSGVLISITDNGPGISEEKLKNIFSQFYRVDESRNKDCGGLGLGLAIAKELVKAHEGEIWAESNENGGATVSFSLCKTAEISNEGG
jgi:signal transduction histidine kinase